MANYEASARTGYVKVANEEEFLAWADKLFGVKLIKREDLEHGMLYGFLFTEGVGAYREDPDGGDDLLEIDFLEEVREHIAEGWGLAVVEVGGEARKYLVGHALVVTRDSISSTTLDDFLKETAARLGVHVGLAEY